MTCRAIGAAVAPPVSDWFWSTTAIASFGFFPGSPAKAMNQVVLLPSMPVSAVPVLPPISRPGDLRRGARAGLDGAHHHRADVPRGRGRDRAPDLRRLRPAAGLAVRRHDLLDHVRAHQDAVVADRARDHRHLLRRHEQPLLAERHPARVDVAVALRVVELAVAVEAARQPLALGRLERRPLVEAELLRLLDDALGAELEADVAEHRVDRELQRRRERHRAERPRSCRSCSPACRRPCSSRGRRTSTTACTCRNRSRPTRSRP